MKKVAFLIIMLGFAMTQTWAQNKYFTKTGNIHFFSKATMENIEADNNTVTCVIDAGTGKMEFAVLMKSFIFEKALMQEHFNENYVESTKFPKSTFQGQISDPSKVKWTTNGTYNVTVSGALTIKGKTNQVSAPGTITVANGKVTAASTFQINLADYDIKIPATVKSNISEKIEIRVKTQLSPL